MHNPMQPDPAYQPPRMTERRRPVEPGSISQPGFQPKRRDDTDKGMPSHELPGSLAPEPGNRPPLDSGQR